MPLGEVLHSVEICFVTSLLKIKIKIKYRKFGNMFWAFAICSESNIKLESYVALLVDEFVACAATLI